MISGDLKLAGIPYEDENGDDFDFHALRHQFITDLARADVSLNVAKELARPLQALNSVCVGVRRC